MKQSVRKFAKSLYLAAPQSIRQRADRLLALRTFRQLRVWQLPSEIVRYQNENRRPVSIVIPSYNDLPYLRKCIHSIHETCSDFEYEVLVIDDYCSPEVQSDLKALESGTVKVLLKDSRQGFAATVNVGMNMAKYDVVLLNSDIVTLPGWLDALQYSAYARDPKIGLVSGKLIYPNGKVQYGGTYHARRFAPQWFSHLYVGSSPFRPLANVATYNFGISGACMYVTSQAHAILGGLDPEYWLGFEDVDYAMSAWSAGFRCFYEPNANLIHHESASRGYSQGPRELKSMRRFWSRWGRIFGEKFTRLDAKEIDLVFSESCTPLWRSFLASAAADAYPDGVNIHEVNDSKLDEDLITKLSQKNSVKIAGDINALDVVWLSSISNGVPVHLVNSLEFDSAILNPELLALYRTEFYYLSPNPAIASVLHEQTAWASEAVVAPAFISTSTTLTPVNGRVVVLTPPGMEFNSLVKRLTTDDVKSVIAEPAEVTEQLCAEIATLSPSVVISLFEHKDCLIPSTIMSLGAVFCGWKNEFIQHTVLDGQNALLADCGDLGQLSQLVNDVLMDNSIRDDLISNGRTSAVREFHHTVETLRALPHILS